ncbi:MAG: hypothetical protein U1B30_10575 [Pseudomonadota bacterium]|nr:hypothetical protein [Pseudomonadota bacterium]
MKLSRLSVAFLGAISLILSVNVFALGWEECKHLYRELNPEQAAACKANNQSCLVNNFQYSQCRLTAPDPIQYVTIDGQSSSLANSVAAVARRYLVLPQKGVASNHNFSWPYRLGNVRIEYAFVPRGVTTLQWGMVGVYSPGSTYTIIDYSRYVPASAVWPGGSFCGGGTRPVAKPEDASIYFRLRVEDSDGADPKKSSWSYLDATSLYYGTDIVCMPRGSIR